MIFTYLEITVYVMTFAALLSERIIVTRPIIFVLLEPSKNMFPDQNMMITMRFGNMVMT